MHIEENLLDDLLIELYPNILKNGLRQVGRRGPYIELPGVLLTVKQPLSRLSNSDTKGNIFSCLGELLWYLSGSNEFSFIKHYLPYDKFVCVGEDDKIDGAYGPKLNNMHNSINQVDYVVKALKESPSSRQAVIQLYDASDIYNHQKNIPCTLSLQFLLRDNKLSLFTSMRSNDAAIGLPHDFFCFTMLQEIVANRLKCELGEYKHFVGSLHIYEKDISQIQKYVDEGYGPSKPLMGRMPATDIERSLKNVLKEEALIRQGQLNNLSELKLEPYWQDILKLLQIHSLYKNCEQGVVQSCIETISSIKRSLSTREYDHLVDKKINLLNRKLHAKR